MQEARDREVPCTQTQAEHYEKRLAEATALLEDWAELQRQAGWPGARCVHRQTQMWLTRAPSPAAEPAPTRPVTTPTQARIEAALALAEAAERIVPAGERDDREAFKVAQEAYRATAPKPPAGLDLDRLERRLQYDVKGCGDECDPAECDYHAMLRLVRGFRTLSEDAQAAALEASVALAKQPR